MPASFFAEVPLDEDTSTFLSDVLEQVRDLLAQSQNAVSNVTQTEQDVAQLLTDAQALIATIPASGTSPWKAPVRVAESAAIDVLSPPGAFDGVSVLPGDRVLLTNQSVVSENGIWEFVGASVPLVRPEDADSPEKRGPGIFVFALEGTMNANSLYFATGSTDNLTFNQFVAASSGVTLRELDISGFLQSTLPAASTVFAYAPSRSVTIPPNFSGSSAVTAGSPTGLIGLDVRVGGTSVGTLLVEASGVSRFEAANPSASIPVPAGTVISLVSPDPVRDAADISFTISATLD